MAKVRIEITEWEGQVDRTFFILHCTSHTPALAGDGVELCFRADYPPEGPHYLYFETWGTGKEAGKKLATFLEQVT